MEHSPPDLAGIGEGTWAQVIGEHRWEISMQVQVSNGDRVRSEGVIDLETLTYKGELFEG